MPSPTQVNRIASVSSGLGDDVLLFLSMTGSENLSRLFKYEIDLLSERNNIGPTDILGTSLTVELVLEAGGHRYFNGIVTRFSQLGSLGDYNHYRATLQPTPWLLTRIANCRIFQQQTVPDMVKTILGDVGFSDVEEHLNTSYVLREFCVQYRETDFDFISRLLEEEGIYYYFKHAEGKHTLVLCDNHAAHDSYGSVLFYPPDNRYRRNEEHIFDWNLSQEIQTGVYHLNDFNFETPSTDLKVKLSISEVDAEQAKEVYDYPGGYAKKDDLADHYVRCRMEEQRARFEQMQARGNTRGLAVGRLFSLAQHPRDDQNREYLVVSSLIQVQSNAYVSAGQADGTEEYQCAYGVISSAVAYRAPAITRKPIVQGPQTAIVVGPAGEEIYTDKYGRVKVQFHWDRYGSNDENSSCWVRVAQVWAGKSWGAMYIPRIGQEVIVDFLEGDPDHPIVTGRVYNAEQMPPYTLPDNMTQSGVKSRSSKGGGEDNFNEIRFEDKKGSEEIYIQAEKDFTRLVKNNDSLTVKNGDSTAEIDQGNHSLTVKTGNSTSELDQGNYSLTLKAGNKTVKLNAGSSSEEAMQSIELKVGQSSILINQQGVTIKGMTISIQGQMQTEVKGAMATVSGDGMLTLKGGVVMIN